MAHILVDRVKETTTTTGTGTLALLGAVAQFRAFSAVMANNDTTLYAIVGQTGTEWEVGVGTWTTGNNLARTTILASSNAGSVVTLSAGTKNVFMTLTPAGRWPGQTFTGAVTPATNDAAALGSATLSWADLFLADGGVINWNNGTVTFRQSATDTLVIFGAKLQSAPGTTTYPPVELQVGSMMTTPSDGAIEIDATNMYGTTDVGNRGYIPIRHFIRANATRTYTSNTSSQAIFNGTPNGRLTLETGTYWFDGFLSFGTMSATIGNRSIAMLGAGTAVTSNWAWIAVGADVAFGAAAAGGVTHMVTATSPASVVTATTGTSLGVRIAGSFEVNTAGTIIPSTTMVTAAASTLSMGSFLGFERVGTDGVVSVGQWD